MTSIELRIRSTYDSLSNAERKVADYLLDNMENVFNLPISALAQEAGVSKVAWVRFCKAIGFDGLKDLKKALFAQIQKQTDDYAAAHEKHEKMGCICFENTAMGLYFIEDPDGYWFEIVPAKR